MKRISAIVLSVLLSISILATDFLPVLASPATDYSGLLTEAGEKIEESGNLLNDNSETGSLENSEENSENKSEIASEDYSEVNSEEISEVNSEEVPEETSEENSEKNSEENSEEDSENNSEEDSEEVSEDNSEENSEDDLQEETSEEESEEFDVIVPGSVFTKEQLIKQEEAKEQLEVILSDTPVSLLIYLAETYDMKQTPEKNSKTVASLNSGTTVFLDGIELDSNHNIWMKVIYYTQEAKYNQYSGNEFSYESVYEDKDFANEGSIIGVTGYVEEKNLITSCAEYLAWEEEYKDAFIIKTNDSVNNLDSTDEEISKFPESFHAKLTALKKSHPNWHFVPFNTGVTLDMAVEAQYLNNRSLVPRGSYYAENDIQIEPGWVQAKKEGIRYYLDSKNFLNEDNIFQFEHLTYNSSNASLSILETLFKGTFMDSVCPKGDYRYANVVLQAGIESKVSPLHLGSRILQEQGAGKSALISGTYPGYEGYYNYFNFKASGPSSEIIIKNGLEYAKQQGWTTPYLSIVGGSKLLGKNYINIGQDTIYLQKFDFVGDSYYTHQYMQNLLAPYNEGRKMKKTYAECNSMDLPFVFKIPVFYENLSIHAAKKDMNFNSTNQITVLMGGTEIDPSSIRFESLDETIATIDANGVMTSYQKPGSVKIKATYIGSITAFKNKSISVTVNVCGIKIANTTNLIRRGATMQTVVSSKLPSSLSNKKLYYSSSDESVMQVNSSGLMTAVSVGSCELIVTAGDFTDRFEIFVCPYGFSLYGTKYNMNPQEKITIVPSFATEDIKNQSSWPEEIKNGSKIFYSSQNPSIATVDQTGVVTAISVGKTMITAHMACGFEKQVEVNVASKITFVNSISGESEKIKYVPYEGTIKQLPEAKEMDGYVFAGWYALPEGKGNLLKTDTILYKDSIFYAYYVSLNDEFTVMPLGTYYYTGKAIKPQPEVYDGERKLIYNKDYTLEYNNNTNAGKATIKVKGKGNYSGVSEASFEILPMELTDSKISVTTPVAVYDKKEKKLKPVLSYGTKKLTYKTDYTLEYNDPGDYKAPGKYLITIKATEKNYTGTLLAYMEITDKTDVAKLSVSSIPKQVYNDGNQICPKVTVKKGSVILSEGIDYSLYYEDNKEIGTATLTVKGMGNYYGEKRIKFQITGKSISSAKLVNFISSVPYDGTEKKQTELKVLYKDEELVENKDYVISYTNNTKNGKATLVITGINRFSGTIKKSFTITPCDMNLSSDDFTAEVSQQVVYLKGGSKAEVELFYKGERLTEGVDYTLSYKNNKSVTSFDCAESKLPMVTIKGKGRFKGSKSYTYRIINSSLKRCLSNSTAADVVFKNKVNSYKTKLVIKDMDGKTLSAGKDYEKEILYLAAETIILENGRQIKSGESIPLNEIIPAGSKIKAVITGKGFYEGSTMELTYRIVKKSISGATVVVLKQIYTGKEIVPVISEVRFGKTEYLTADDYEIVPGSLKNNVNKGTASMVIRGKGNYGGEKTVKFTITNKPILFSFLYD